VVLRGREFVETIGLVFLGRIERDDADGQRFSNGSRHILREKVVDLLEIPERVAGASLAGGGVHLEVRRLHPAPLRFRGKDGLQR